ncbi:unnamed protein product, partial [Owenia fusiformis]
FISRDILLCMMESGCTSNHSPSVQSQTDTKCMECETIFVKKKKGFKRKSLKSLRSSTKTQDWAEDLLQRGGDPRKSFVCQECITKYITYYNQAYGMTLNSPSLPPPSQSNEESVVHSSPVQVHAEPPSPTSQATPCAPNESPIPEIPIEIFTQKLDHSYNLTPKPPKPVRHGNAIIKTAMEAVRRSNYRRLIKLLFQQSKKFRLEFQRFVSKKVKIEIKAFTKKMKPYKNWSDLLDESSSTMPILASTIKSAVPKQMYNSKNEDDQAARVGVVTSILCYCNNPFSNQFQKMTSYQLWKHGCDRKMMHYLNQLGLALCPKANLSVVKRTDKEQLEQWDEFYSSKGIKRQRSPTEEGEENNANKQQKVDQSSETDVNVPKLSTQIAGSYKPGTKPTMASRRSARKSRKKLLGKE